MSKSIIAYKFKNYIPKKTFTHRKSKDKSLNCFKHQINLIIFIWFGGSFFH